MRKLVVCNIVSLDGFYEGPGANVMALPMDGFFDAYNLQRQRAADTLLLGATSYSMFRSYWPAVADDPTASPAFAQEPAVADLLREIGERNNSLRKVVVSDSITTGDTAPWTATTTIVRRADAHRVVTELRNQEGGEILVFGSRTLWNDLLVSGLVDELHIMVGATVLGGGTPAFGTGPVPPLRLLGTSRQDGSENVVLRYAPVSAEPR